MNRYPKIEIIDEAYEIPQLGRSRRISVLLPFDYDQTDKEYAVLYLHDGQNLFNEYAPYGNWAVDKALKLLADHGYSDLIVVAIDHGGELRIKELLPYNTQRFRESEGELYLNFMMHTLKPMIDSRYRVRKGRESTGIGGSSLGGLISLYAGFNFSSVFGKLMIFSPSLWVSKKIYHEAEFMNFHEPTTMYLYAGGMESPTHLQNVNKLNEILVRKDNLTLRYVTNPEGKHQEVFWGEQFPMAVDFLYI
ncbi:MAG: alpha/beta hydrolase [Saprospiraceae bacterium]|nr:alpha/beta hydrolase [Saprospiraceae bacterium]